MTAEAAADELRRVSGTQFDPDVVDVFLGLLDSRRVAGRAGGLTRS